MRLHTVNDYNEYHTVDPFKGDHSFRLDQHISSQNPIKQHCNFSLIYEVFLPNYIKWNQIIFFFYNSLIKKSGKELKYFWGNSGLSYLRSACHNIQVEWPGSVRNEGVQDCDTLTRSQSRPNPKESNHSLAKIPRTWTVALKRDRDEKISLIPGKTRFPFHFWKKKIFFHQL